MPARSPSTKSSYRSASRLLLTSTGMSVRVPIPREIGTSPSARLRQTSPVGERIDRTGGLEPAKDFYFAARPDDDQMRESASVWVFDDAGSIALPRLGIEAVAERWDARGIQVNVAFPDGRAVVVRDL